MIKLPIESSPDYIRIKVATVANVKRFRFKTIDDKRGIRGLLAFPSKGGSKIVSYLFSRKKGWTVSKAKQWVKSHGESVSETYYVHDIIFHNGQMEFVEETVPENVEESSEPKAPIYSKIDWLRDELNG